MNLPLFTVSLIMKARSSTMYGPLSLEYDIVQAFKVILRLFGTSMKVFL